MSSSCGSQGSWMLRTWGQLLRLGVGQVTWWVDQWRRRSQPDSEEPVGWPVELKSERDPKDKAILSTKLSLKWSLAAQAEVGTRLRKQISRCYSFAASKTCDFKVLPSHKLLVLHSGSCGGAGSREQGAWKTKDNAVRFLVLAWILRPFWKDHNLSPALSHLNFFFLSFFFWWGEAG